MRIPPEILILMNVWCFDRFQTTRVQFTAERSQVPGKVVSLNVADAVEGHYSRRRRRIIRCHLKVLLTLVPFLRITFSSEVWLQDTPSPFFSLPTCILRISKYIQSKLYLKLMLNQVPVSLYNLGCQRCPHSQTTEFCPRSATDMDTNYTRDNVN
jgi:hypothetical protein